MAQHNRVNRPAAAARRDGDGKLLAVHFATVVLVVVDFVMFQAAAAGVTAAIYYTVPGLDAGIMRGESSWTWIRIFQIVSPTITLPGGAATMLSSYFLARRAQEESRRAQEESQRAQEESQRAQEQARRADAAEARAENLQAQLERSRSPRRRRLRNAATRPPAAR